MSSSAIATDLIGALLLPPLNLILVCALGCALQRSYPRLGRSLSLAALVLLAGMSTPAGASLVARPLEQRGTLPAAPPGLHAEAIVVLGGSGVEALYRTRYAAQLHRQTGLPLLVTGANPSMIANLKTDYGTPIRWIENQATNTKENAQFAAAMLKAVGVQRILLVTDAIHMARARMMFADQGLAVVAAPANFYSHDALQFADFLPSGEGLRRSHYAMHEWLGIVWYRLRH